MLRLSPWSRPEALGPDSCCGVPPSWIWPEGGSRGRRSHAGPARRRPHRGDGRSKSDRLNRKAGARGRCCRWLRVAGRSRRGRRECRGSRGNCVEEDAEARWSAVAGGDRVDAFFQGALRIAAIERNLDHQGVRETVEQVIGAAWELLVGRVVWHLGRWGVIAPLQSHEPLVDTFPAPSLAHGGVVDFQEDTLEGLIYARQPVPNPGLWWPRV